MNENIIENIIMEVNAVNKNFGALPKAEAASIHVDGNKGKKTDGKYAASAFIIMVKCNGEWRPENEWLHKAGMKTPRRVYADTVKGGVVIESGLEKAKKAKAEILAKWGVAAAPKAKKAPAKAKTPEEIVADMDEATRQRWLSLLMAPVPVAAVS